MRTIKWSTTIRAGLVSLFGVASCSTVPSLTPHVSYVEIREQIKQATLIVVGVVQGEDVLRTVDSRTSGPLELCAVRIRVEGVLEGQFNDERLTFYYYRVTGAWDGPEPNFINRGDRCIFYLVRDGGVWRAPTDAYASHTRLETGEHRISQALNKDQVRETIVQLLLVPGEDVDATRYARSLPRNESLAMDLVGKTRVSQIFQSLLASPVPEIRGRACIVLAEFPLEEKACLPEVIGDVHALPEDRKRAQELLRSN